MAKNEIDSKLETLVREFIVRYRRFQDLSRICDKLSNTHSVVGQVFASVADYDTARKALDKQGRIHKIIHRWMFENSDESRDLETEIIGIIGYGNWFLVGDDIAVIALNDRHHNESIAIAYQGTGEYPVSREIYGKGPYFYEHEQ